ncbi:MAG: hypothetical protein ACFBSD_10410 [Paracoccaceae bacterium]
MEDVPNRPGDSAYSVNPSVTEDESAPTELGASPDNPAMRFALDLSQQGVGLFFRDTAGCWQAAGEAAFGDPDFERRLAALRRLARMRTGAVGPAMLWLPEEQVLVRRARLDGGPAARQAAAEALLERETPYARHDLALAVSEPDAEGRVTLLGALAQTWREAVQQVEDWGFQPGIVSTRWQTTAFGRAAPVFRPVDRPPNIQLPPIDPPVDAPAPIDASPAARTVSPLEARAADLRRGPGLSRAGSAAHRSKPRRKTRSGRAGPGLLGRLAVLALLLAAGGIWIGFGTGTGTGTGDLADGTGAPLQEDVGIAPADRPSTERSMTDAPTDPDRTLAALRRLAPGMTEPTAGVAPPPAASDGPAALRDDVRRAPSRLDPPPLTLGPSPEPPILTAGAIVADRLAEAPSAPSRPEAAAAPLVAVPAPAPERGTGQDLLGPAADAPSLPDIRTLRTAEAEVAPPVGSDAEPARPPVPVDLRRPGLEIALPADLGRALSALSARRSLEPARLTPPGTAAWPRPRALSPPAEPEAVPGAEVAAEPSETPRAVLLGRQTLPDALPIPTPRARRPAQDGTAEDALLSDAGTPTAREDLASPSDAAPATVETEPPTALAPERLGGLPLARPDRTGGAPSPPASPPPRETSPEPDAARAPRPEPLAVAVPVPEERPDAPADRRAERDATALLPPLPGVLRPTGRNVRQAARERGLPLDQLSLIGVLDLEDGRRALLRLPDGGIRRVKTGDRIESWTVGAIGRDALRLLQAGDARTLLLVGR